MRSCILPKRVIFHPLIFFRRLGNHCVNCAILRFCLYFNHSGSCFFQSLPLSRLSSSIVLFLSFLRNSICFLAICANIHYLESKCPLSGVHRKNQGHHEKQTPVFRKKALKKRTGLLRSVWVFLVHFYFSGADFRREVF